MQGPGGHKSKGSRGQPRRRTKILKHYMVVWNMDAKATFEAGIEFKYARSPVKSKGTSFLKATEDVEPLKVHPEAEPMQTEALLDESKGPDEGANWMNSDIGRREMMSQNISVHEAHDMELE